MVNLQKFTVKVRVHIFLLDICVGSSKTNSHRLAGVRIDMHEDEAGNRTFQLNLDGTTVRSAVMTADKKFFDRDPEAA